MISHQGFNCPNYPGPGRRLFSSSLSGRQLPAAPPMSEHDDRPWSVISVHRVLYYMTTHRLAMEFTTQFFLIFLFNQQHTHYGRERERERERELAEVIRAVEYILSIWTELCRILEGAMPRILPVLAFFVPSLSLLVIARQMIRLSDKLLPFWLLT